jgi:hypothetical protein
MRENLPLETGGRKPETRVSSMDAKPSNQAGPVLVLVVIVLITGLLFPGDAMFMSDEALLLEHALIANHQPLNILGISLPFTPARAGLQGFRGYEGPFAVWVYQIFLLMTHDPVVMVAVRAVLVGGSTALGLAWLARSMRLSPWYAPLSMLSPWLWVYSRDLWDNSFGIPLAAIAVAGYADFLITRRRWPLLLAAVSLAAMSLVHLMSAPLIAAIGLHAMVFQRRSVARFRWGLLLIGILWCCAFARYFQTSPIGNSVKDMQNVTTQPGWWNPLLGGHHLTAAFDWLPSTRGHLPLIVVVCQGISLLPHLAVWIGMGRAVLLARRPLRSLTPVDHLALLAVAVAVLQGLLDGMARVGPEPNYFNATWIAYLILAWYAVDALCRWVWKPAITVLLPVAAYAAAMTIVLSYSILLIHHNGGTRSIDYGTVLEDQMRAARRIQQFSPNSPIDITYLQWRSMTSAKDVLVELLPPPIGPRPLRRLLVRYRNEYPQDARIAVEDFPILDNPP